MLSEQSEVISENEMLYRAEYDASKHQGIGALKKALWKRYFSSVYLIDMGNIIAPR
jgi:hypothetical protein